MRLMIARCTVDYAGRLKPLNWWSDLVKHRPIRGSDHLMARGPHPKARSGSANLALFCLRSASQTERIACVRR